MRRDHVTANPAPPGSLRPLLFAFFGVQLLAVVAALGLPAPEAFADAAGHAVETVWFWCPLPR